jgi:hypothetical protein
VSAYPGAGGCGLEDRKGRTAAAKGQQQEAQTKKRRTNLRAWETVAVLKKIDKNWDKGGLGLKEGTLQKKKNVLESWKEVTNRGSHGRGHCFLQGQGVAAGGGTSRVCRGSAPF